MDFTPAEHFMHVAPSHEAVWRAIILFGRNVASYKFALGKSLLDLARAGQTQVTLEELARPYSRHLCEHLRQVDRQGTSASSQFLTACRKFNQGQLSEADLIGTTAKLGFVNVIDAFHIVGQGEVAHRFFTDDRKQGGGLTFTDEVLSLAAGAESPSLVAEVEARWRLVETAWDLGVTTSVLEIAASMDAERRGGRCWRKSAGATQCDVGARRLERLSEGKVLLLLHADLPRSHLPGRGRC